MLLAGGIHALFQLRVSHKRHDRLPLLHHHHLPPFQRTLRAHVFVNHSTAALAVPLACVFLRPWQ